MPRVNFYLLNAPDEDGRRRFACRLADKLQRQGTPLQIYAKTEDEAAELDLLLWNYIPESFLPHALIGTAGADQAGVVISWGMQLARAPNLLNLSDGQPPTPERFKTIAEFVPDEAHARSQSRELWQAYRQAGFELQHHDIS